DGLPESAPQCPPLSPSGLRRWYTFFFSSRRRHTRFSRDWSSDVCSSDLVPVGADTGQAETDVNTFGQKVGETPAGDVSVGADTSLAEEELHIFGSRAGDVSATVIIDADTYYGEDQLRQFQSAVNEAGGTVTINGETMNGQQALSALVAEVNAGQG